MFSSIVEAVLSFAEKQPDKMVVADEIRSVTYAQYKDEICRFVSVLREMGIKKNDKIVVEASQTIDFLAFELAIHIAGGVFVPLERNCAWDKVVRIVKLSDAVLAVSNKKHEEIGTVMQKTLSELKERADAAAPAQDYTLPDADAPADILFSTGTTGKEKGIVASHLNSVAIGLNAMHGLGILNDNIELVPSPLNHSFGLRRYYGNMVAGASVVLVTGVMNVLGFFNMMDKYKVTAIDLVPTALNVLLRFSKEKFYEYKDIIRYIQFGSAPLSEIDKQKICKLLPNSRLYNVYGSTEGGCICVYNFNVENAKGQCIGKAAYDAKIIVVDENRNEIRSSKDNVGLFASFSPMNMLGYWKDEEETAKALYNGGVYSNDEVYFDEDGDIILLGRKGDVLNVGGNKVSPDEIEDIAKKHPDVQDCGCIGVSDEIKGSVPKLFVQVKKGSAIDPVEFRNYLASNLEPYKVPGFIEQIDMIPRSFNGKLLRRKLREYNEK